MNSEITVALIGVAGIVITVLGSIIVQLITAKRTRTDLLTSMQHQSELADERIKAQLDTHQAVTDTKIDELTREVRDHNNFARRMPVVEEQIKVVNNRLADLEAFQQRITNDGK